MALEGASKNLGAFDAKVDSAILDCGNRGLGNASEFGQLALTEFLEFAQDSNRFSDRNIDATLGRAKLFHLKASDNREASPE